MGKIIGFRHVAVHNYPELQMDQVWSYVEVDVPTLKTQLEKLL